MKQFRYKLINKIVPSKEIRFVWKISQSSSCSACHHITETYTHLFIKCGEIQHFWDKIIDLFKYCGLTNNVKTLKNIVIWYKIDNPNYFNINVLFSLIGFSIYKGYFISESRLNSIDYFSIFTQEFNEMLFYLKLEHKMPCDLFKKVALFIN